MTPKEIIELRNKAFGNEEQRKEAGRLALGYLWAKQLE